MRKKTRFLILSIIIIMVILTVLLLTPLPFIFSRNIDIDINSGDERQQTVLFTFIIKEEINQTPFSREVRRLGIPIKENRKWERALISTLTRSFHARNYSSYIRYNIIVEIFDEINMPDNERSIILKRVLTYLQNGKHDELRDEYSAMLKKMIPVGPKGGSD